MNAGDVIERYRLIRPLGEGGMGTVWLAEHVSLRGTHALKVLDRHLLADRRIRDRFLEEGHIQASLVHPAIVRVTDLVTDGVAGLVMDFIDGPDLGGWLESNGPASADEARAILATLLDAIALAHKGGIVHRDLKPANVLMRRGRISPVVVDFGIAKVVEASGKGRTRTGASMGTPGYMAPEQVKDASSADHRSDLYALGVILHELLTGKPRFQGDSDFDVMRAVVDGDATPLPPGLDRTLVACVARATAADPSARFQSAEAFADALGVGSRCLSCGLSTTMVPPAASESTPQPASTPVPEPPPNPALFDVVFVGETESGVDAVSLLQLLLGLDIESARELVADVPTVVSAGLSAAAATKLKAGFFQTGANVLVVVHKEPRVSVSSNLGAGDPDLVQSLKDWCRVLVHREGSDEQAVIQLTQVSMAIGASPDNDIRIKGDASVAPHHCVLRLRGVGAVILGVHGNKVNIDGKVSRSGWLLGGERIVVGSTELRYQVVDS